MLDRLLQFTGALRKAGVPVAVSEEIDALRAIKYVDLVEKDDVRAALATTMVKSESHRDAFDTLFDLYFATGRGPEEFESRDKNDRVESP